MKDNLHKTSFMLNNFRKFSVIVVSAITSYNKMQDQIVEMTLKDLRPSKIKWLLTDKFMNSYWPYLPFLLNFVHSMWIYNGYCIAASIWLCFPHIYNIYNIQYIYNIVYIIYIIYINITYIYIYIYIYILYIYPQTRVSSFSELISVARVNE